MAAPANAERASTTTSRPPVFLGWWKSARKFIGIPLEISCWLVTWHDLKWLKHLEKSWSSSMGLGWHPIYEMEKKSHDWNHQPEYYLLLNITICIFPLIPTIIYMKWKIKAMVETTKQHGDIMKISCPMDPWHLSRYGDKTLRKFWYTPVPLPSRSYCTWIHRDGDITDILGGKINGDLEISLWHGIKK